MKHPWMKFYPADWQADQALGMCSLAARGLWMEMLAIMHKADPYGHLLVNGKAPTDLQVASLSRCPQDQIPSLLDELESAGVFSRTRTGAIYSRRLTRDEKRRKDGEEAAKSGTLLHSRRGRKTKEISDVQRPPPRVVIGVEEQPPFSLEARDLDIPPINPPEEKKTTKSRKRRQLIPLPDDWQPSAELMAWQQQFRPNVDPAFETNRFRAWAQGRMKKDWDQTWRNWVLNARLTGGSFKPTGKPDYEMDTWAARLEGWKQSKTWLSAWGPEPGEFGCRAPEQLLKKSNFEFNQTILKSVEEE